MNEWRQQMASGQPANMGRQSKKATSSLYIANKNIDEVVQDDWLMSFIDIITLLLAAMVMLFAINQFAKSPAELEGKLPDPINQSAIIDSDVISQIQERKINESAEHNTEVISEIQARKARKSAEHDTEVISEIPAGKPRKAAEHDAEVISGVQTRVARQSTESGTEVSRGILDRRKNLIASLEKVIQGIEDKKQLELKVGNQQINLSIGESVLFRLGDSALLTRGREIINKIKPVLDEGTYQIVVEGFTDNLPINNRRFPSNWELSATRASGVVRYLIAQGIDANRLQATGFADTRPVASNKTAQGRRLNRRVNLVLRVAEQPDQGN